MLYTKVYIIKFSYFWVKMTVLSVVIKTGIVKVLALLPITNFEKYNE